MTTATIEPGVRAGQRKLRLFRMIERPDTPVIRRVAGVAVGPQRALVHVLDRVATVAAGGSFAEVEAAVTLRTAHDIM